MKSTFKQTSLLSRLFCVVFGLLIFSIPVFSYQSRLYLITWALTVLLVGIVFVDIIFIKKKFFVDIVILSLLCFCLFAVISSALNRFKGFGFTPLFLCVLATFVYHFLKQNKDLRIEHIFIVSLIGLSAFLLVFIVVYREKLLHFDFSSRLGGDFGDENDIAIANALGFTLSFYFLLFDKKVFVKILSAILAVLFGLCGLASGSKIFILLAAVIFMFLIAYKNGRKRLWLTILMLCVFLLIIILIFSMPQFSTIKERCLSFIATLTGISFGNVDGNDLSTIFRMNMFRNGLQMFLRKPLFGFGIDGFSVYGGMNEGWSHNHFSESLCDFGILGTIAFHIPMIASLFLLKKKSSATRLKPLLIMLFFIVCMSSVALFSAKLFSLFSPVMYATVEYRHRDFSLIRNTKERSNNGNC